MSGKSYPDAVHTASVQHAKYGDRICRTYLNNRRVMRCGQDGPYARRTAQAICRYGQAGQRSRRRAAGRSRGPDVFRAACWLTWSAAVALLASAPAGGQTYPLKPVRMVVPFAPGGGLDLTARILAQKLTERAGQSFIVENRTGASGIIGTEFVAKSAPDGYTLLVGSQTTQAVVPAMYKVTYDTSRDFAPVIEIARSPLLIVVHPSL